MFKKSLVFLIIIFLLCATFLITKTHITKLTELKTAKNELQQLIEPLPDKIYTTSSYENLIEKRKDAIKLLKTHFLIYRKFKT